MIKTGLSLAAAAAALGASLAHAQMADPVVNPHGMIPNFDATNLGPVLNDLGIVWQERRTADGRPFIAASIGGALSFNIVQTACDPASGLNCVGMQVFASYQGVKANAQTVAAFNSKYAFSSAGMLPESNAAYISRYEIADYGIPRGNIASSLYSFFEIARRFEGEMRTGASTVSANGYADDLSASMLNRQSGADSGVVAAAAPTSFAALHQAALEETPRLVRAMMDAENAPKNKISNVTQ